MLFYYTTHLNVPFHSTTRFIKIFVYPQKGICRFIFSLFAHFKYLIYSLISIIPAALNKSNMLVFINDSWSFLSCFLCFSCFWKTQKISHIFSLVALFISPWHVKYYYLIFCLWYCLFSFFLIFNCFWNIWVWYVYKNI